MSTTAMESKFVDINGARMHYIEEGAGDPILFLHGVPTSSHVWRYIIPELSQSGRCIAPDLIGLGESDKPDIGYKITDHIDYITKFIDALELKNITLVLQGWGSLIGFAYAMAHPDKVKGIAFFESYVRPITSWDMMSLPMQELATIVNQKDQHQVLADTDYFVERLLPRALLKDMSMQDIEIYKHGLASSRHRQPLLQYLKELPTGEEPAYVTRLMSDCSEKLQTSDIPKLLIYGVPGYNTVMSTIAWAKDSLPNLKMFDIGPMMHFPQLSHPKEVSDAIAEWREEIS